MNHQHSTIYSLHPMHAAGDYRTQFHVKAEKTAEALSAGQYDFGFLHIKAVDDTGHDQQPVLKVCGHIALLMSGCTTLNSLTIQPVQYACCSTHSVWSLRFDLLLHTTKALLHTVALCCILPTPCLQCCSPYKSQHNSISITVHQAGVAAQPSFPSQGGCPEKSFCSKQ